MAQKEVAAKLNMSQQEYSRIESRPDIDDELLSKIAQALNVSEEVIRNINNGTTIQNVFQHNGNNGNGFHYIHNNEMMVEMYERLLAEKDRIIEMQKEMMDLFMQKQSE